MNIYKKTLLLFVFMILGSITAGFITPNTVSAADINPLPSGQTLNPGDRMVSGGSAYTLIMQGDGNAVIYNTSNQALWNSATFQAGSRLVMQGDGNAVIYNTSNQALWNSATYGNPGSQLVLQADGNLVTYNASSQPTWSRYTGKIYTNTLFSGQILYPGDRMVSSDSVYRLIMQGDGNLVLYNASNQAVWNTATFYPGSRLVMQGDGNLVLYNASNQAVWNTATFYPGSRLVMQGDGNVVIYLSSSPIWSRNTGKLPTGK